MPPNEDKDPKDQQKAKDTKKETASKPASKQQELLTQQILADVSAIDQLARKNQQRQASAKATNDKQTLRYCLGYERALNDMRAIILPQDEE